MVNSNAARHLLLVVTILLCFFVYMGHLIWGRSVDPDAAIVESMEIAGLNPSRNDPSQTSLMTVNDAPASPTSPSSVRAPIATPSATPQPLAGRETVPDLGSSLAPPSSRRESSLTPPSSATALKPPSGSIEETTSLLPPGGEITALTPSRGASEEPVSLALGLGLPGAGGSEGRADDEGDFDPAAVSLAPPSSAGGLKPAPSSSAPSSARPSSPPSEDPVSGEQESFDAFSPGGAAPERAGGGVSLSPPAGSGGSLAPPPMPGGAMQPPPASRDDGVASGTGMRPVSSPPTQARPPAPSSVQPSPTRPGAVAPAAGNAAASGSEEMRVYIIRPGDTLSRIAARELGSASLANNIFLFNRGVIDDPDQLLVGTRILLPARDSAGHQTTVPQQRPPVAGTPPQPGAVAVPPTPVASERATIPPGAQQNRVHRVARGDTLSSIALRYYGSSSAWRFLYESNTDVIANPNQLQVGTELVIPLYGERR